MPAPKINELTTPVGQLQLLGLEVLNWRFDCLEIAGYPTDIAVMLAERGDVDLHEACALLRRGATIHQALRILT